MSSLQNCWRQDGYEGVECEREVQDYQNQLSDVVVWNVGQLCDYQVEGMAPNSAIFTIQNHAQYSGGLSDSKRNDILMHRCFHHGTKAAASH